MVAHLLLVAGGSAILACAQVTNAQTLPPPPPYAGPNPCADPSSWLPDLQIAHPNQPSTIACGVEAGAYFNNLTAPLNVTACALVPNELAANYTVNVGIILGDLAQRGCCGASAAVTCTGAAANPCANPSDFLPNQDLNNSAANRTTCGAEATYVFSSMTSVSTTPCGMITAGVTVAQMVQFFTQSGCCGPSQAGAACSSAGAADAVTGPRQLCTGVYDTFAPGLTACSGVPIETHFVSQTCAPLGVNLPGTSTVYTTLATNTTHVLWCSWLTQTQCTSGTLALARGASPMWDPVLAAGGCKAWPLTGSVMCDPTPIAPARITLSSCGNSTAAPPPPPYAGPNPCADPSSWQPDLQIAHPNQPSTIACGVEAGAYFNNLTAPLNVTACALVPNELAANYTVNVGIILGDLAQRGCCGASAAVTCTGAAANPCANPSDFLPNQDLNNSAANRTTCGAEATYVFSSMTSVSTTPCGMITAGVTVAQMVQFFTQSGCCGSSQAGAVCSSAGAADAVTGPRQVCTGTYQTYSSGSNCSGPVSHAYSLNRTCAPLDDILDVDGRVVYALIARNTTHVVGCSWSTEAQCMAGAAALAQGASPRWDPAVATGGCESGPITGSVSCFNDLTSPNELVVSECTNWTNPTPPPPANTSGGSHGSGGSSMLVIYIAAGVGVAALVIVVVMCKCFVCDGRGRATKQKHRTFDNATFDARASGKFDKEHPTFSGFGNREQRVGAYEDDNETTA
jgi:hypothetical protein